jgi:tRNA-specific 2-thiouridylase
VFTYFLSEYQRGRTPNPDVLCNAEIKFAAFLDYAKMMGAAHLATGHYARLCGDGQKHMYKSADLSKDQTYFLCMLTQAQISGAMFPIGEMQKPDVRAIAGELGLNVAQKKDSTGICFIGERKFRDFLQGFLPAQRGDIKTPEGKIVGQHMGGIYYTLGQRRGLDIGGRKEGTGERWFVVDKDVKSNVLIVEQGETERLFSKACKAVGMNYIAGRPSGSFECMAKFRYRQPDQKVLVSQREEGEHIEFEERQRAVTPGQYAVLYAGDECIGGGVIDEVIF